MHERSLPNIGLETSGETRSAFIEAHVHSFSNKRIVLVEKRETNAIVGDDRTKLLVDIIEEWFYSFDLEKTANKIVEDSVLAVLAELLFPKHCDRIHNSVCEGR